MHDGSERTLADVVAYYDRGGVKNPRLSSDMKPLGLTAQEQVELVEFMKALTGEIDPEVSRLPKPWSPKWGTVGCWPGS
jgi:cytochrome c peroxidase